MRGMPDEFSFFDTLVQRVKFIINFRTKVDNSNFRVLECDVFHQLSFIDAAEIWLIDFFH
jgi:hypothetical protein